ncbi:hypothetical protein CALCODRAFT_497352 [Calocera cornea HHB12733]|uniref:Uncharacterized protein n=1 Tax=Calocera cornea HHB12733 TaxID=1353952 RepID=A0A165FCQ7_9BASI|nr:hypothetical protein CALCODRAFT_497352 [Calocera cornea HHB12733]
MPGAEDPRKVAAMLRTFDDTVIQQTAATIANRLCYLVAKIEITEKTNPRVYERQLRVVTESAMEQFANAFDNNKLDGQFPMRVFTPMSNIKNIKEVLGKYPDPADPASLDLVVEVLNWDDAILGAGNHRLKGSQYWGRTRGKSGVEMQWSVEFYPKELLDDNDPDHRVWLPIIQYLTSNTKPLAILPTFARNWTEAIHTLEITQYSDAGYKLALTHLTANSTNKQALSDPTKRDLITRLMRVPGWDTLKSGANLLDALINRVPEIGEWLLRGTLDIIFDESLRTFDGKVLDVFTKNMTIGGFTDIYSLHNFHNGDGKAPWASYRIPRNTGPYHQHVAEALEHLFLPPTNVEKAKFAPDIYTYRSAITKAITERCKALGHDFVLVTPGNFKREVEKWERFAPLLYAKAAHLEITILSSGPGSRVQNAPHRMPGPLMCILNAAEATSLDTPKGMERFTKLAAQYSPNTKKAWMTSQQNELKANLRKKELSTELTPLTIMAKFDQYPSTFGQKWGTYLQSVRNWSEGVEPPKEGRPEHFDIVYPVLARYMRHIQWTYTGTVRTIEERILTRVLGPMHVQEKYLPGLMSNAEWRADYAILRSTWGAGVPPTTLFDMGADWAVAKRKRAEVNADALQDAADGITSEILKALEPVAIKYFKDADGRKAFTSDAIRGAMTRIKEAAKGKLQETKAAAQASEASTKATASQKAEENRLLKAQQAFDKASLEGKKKILARLSQSMSGTQEDEADDLEDEDEPVNVRRFIDDEAEDDRMDDEEEEPEDDENERGSSLSGFIVPDSQEYEPSHVDETEDGEIEEPHTPAHQRSGKKTAPPIVAPRRGKFASPPWSAGHSVSGPIGSLPTS